MSQNDISFSSKENCIGAPEGPESCPADSFFSYFSFILSLLISNLHLCAFVIHASELT